MKHLLLVLLILICIPAQAQRLFNGVKKISNARGTFWMSWGYNRSFYALSDIHFKSDDYTFELANVAAQDSKYKFVDHVTAETMFKTQFDFRVGYYFRNKYALSFGYDRFDYLMKDANTVSLNGEIDTSLHAVWSGSYKNKQVITNRNDFHYANLGMNFLNLGIQRTDKLYQSRNKNLAFSTSYGAQIGAIISNNTFLFAQELSEKKKSLSGYGISAFASARLEFFRYLFIQAQLNGGSINQFKVLTDDGLVNSYAKHQFWYGQRSISLGFFYYFKPVNGCNDCPVW